MNQESINKPPFWYWIVSIIPLIWNSLGVDGYLGQAYSTERYRSSFTPEQLEITANAPSWIMGAFAIAVFTGGSSLYITIAKKKNGPLNFGLFL